MITKKLLARDQYESPACELLQMFSTGALLADSLSSSIDDYIEDENIIIF